MHQRNNIRQSAADLVKCFLLEKLRNKKSFFLAKNIGDRFLKILSKYNLIMAGLTKNSVPKKSFL